MKINIAALRAEHAALITKGEEILTAMGVDGLTAEKKAELDAQYVEVEKALDEKSTAISRAEKLREQQKAAPAAAVLKEDKTVKVAGNTNAGVITADIDQSKVFRGFGEFMQAVAIAGMPDNKKHTEANERLAYNAAATGLNTTEGPDGGFLVQKDFNTTLLTRAQENSVLLPLCTRIPVGDGFDGVVLPYIDETSRATGSRFGGVQVYRAGEADTVTAKKPKLGVHELKLEDLRGLAYITERGLQDATSLGAILEIAFGSEFGFKIDDEILRGTGAGECLGVLNSSALVTQAKETGQPGSTIVMKNITNMRSRLFARSRASSVWLINQDVEPALAELSLPVGTGGAPVYLPAGGLSQDGYDRLYGRPVLPIEHASTLGTVGDIVLADFSRYAIIEKGGLVMDSSMHVRFIYHEMAFRFSYRINGQPLLKQAITPYKGSNSQSAFVTLATRA